MACKVGRAQLGVALAQEIVPIAALREHNLDHRGRGTQTKKKPAREAGFPLASAER